MYTSKAGCGCDPYIWGLSSAGRASALQAEGHRFEPYRPHQFHNMARWLNWLERPVHTREVESSSLSLATKKTLENIILFKGLVFGKFILMFFSEIKSHQKWCFLKCGELLAEVSQIAANVITFIFLKFSD